MHNLPGGLCTSWKRNGYTFDACIHWLVGSSPESNYNSIWQETGVAQGREFFYADEYCRAEGADGRTVIFHSDIDKLEKHLLEVAPGDREPIMDFIKGIRMCAAFDFPSDREPFFTRTRKQIGTFITFMKYGREFRKWTNITGEQFASRFTDPLLRRLSVRTGFPESRWSSSSSPSPTWANGMPDTP
jgi:phytoene dehydrogenase-like protein